MMRGAVCVMSGAAVTMRGPERRRRMRARGPGARAARRPPALRGCAPLSFTARGYMARTCGARGHAARDYGTRGNAARDNAARAYGTRDTAARDYGTPGTAAPGDAH